MQSIKSGPYLFRLGLYADPDLSPANLGEAFDYYSAVPGWGWRAVVYAVDGPWTAPRVSFGARLGDRDYALPDPEGEAESYFPCGRVVGLLAGGVAFEGGVALPPDFLPALGDDVGVWAAVEDDRGTYGAQLRFRLKENDSWDAFAPAEVALGGRMSVYTVQRWTPADESPRPPSQQPVARFEPDTASEPVTVGDEVAGVLIKARDEARRLRRDRAGSEDLLLGLLAAGGPEAEWLAAQGVGLAEARAAVEFMRTGSLGVAPTQTGSGLLTSAEQLLRLAADEARRAGSGQVEVVHLLLALLRQHGDASAALAWLGLDPPVLLAELRETEAE